MASTDSGTEKVKGGAGAKGTAGNHQGDGNSKSSAATKDTKPPVVVGGQHAGLLPKRVGKYRSDPEDIRELKALYKDKMLPIEKSCQFSKFHHNEIFDAELESKPTVMLVGQYSTGKTTFIRHLIGMEYPEMHIGPEPTTDRFIAVVYGEEPQTIKGNAATAMVNQLPYSGLSLFGASFLNKFSVAVVPAEPLAYMNIIDTPGVLSGEKQRTSRGYDFSKVSRWFAERSDMIILMFDCSKLDISDEFKLVIEELQPHEDKVHCVLNKADQLDSESLMRVYGALLWSMGRIFKGAEVSRIYVGSFRDAPILREELVPLFQKDEEVLKKHLQELPRACSMRKVNEIIKRIRLTVVHLCVLGHLRARMPYLWGKEAAQTRLIERLQEVFDHVRATYNLSEGDFPKIEEFRAKLQISDFSSFPPTDRKTLMVLQDLLSQDIPRIVEKVATRGGGDSAGDGDEAGRVGPKLFTMPTSAEADTEYSSSTLYLAVAVGVLVVAVIGGYIAMSFLDPRTKVAILASLRGFVSTLGWGIEVSLSAIGKWLNAQKKLAGETLTNVEERLDLSAAAAAAAAAIRGGGGGGGGGGGDAAIAPVRAEL